MKKSFPLLGAVVILAALSPLAPNAAAQTKFFTAPYGAGGTYNLYEVVTTPLATWSAADLAAKAKEAQATAVAGVAGNTLTGHLVQIGSEDENTFVALAAALAPNSGNSNLWIGLNDLNDEQGTNRTGWEWSGTVGPDTLDVGEFSAWATGEPNNAGTGEHAGEMRTDGLWNDNVHNSPTRKYVIEWEIGSATPIAGAREVPVVYTARYGTGDTWNLYRVIATAATWPNAHNRAIADTAESTGLASMIGNMTAGHLISCGDSVEAGFAYSATAFGGFGSINTWIGATDDPTYGGTESNGSPTAGWVWAGDPSTPFVYNSWARRPLINGAEPNNGSGTEHSAEIRNDSLWNDITGNTTNIRRYIIEWNIESATPIAGASLGVPFLGGTPDLAPTAGSWKTRTIRNSDAPTGTLQYTINGLPIAASVITNPPAGVTIFNATYPVINFNDVNNTGGAPTGTNGRSLNGLFWPDTAWPTDTNINIDDNHLVLLAQTVVPIPAAGLYTLSIHGDDGFHLRVKAPPGESAMVVRTGGLGRVDAGDPSAVMYPLGIVLDSNTRVVYEVSAPGNYVVEYLHYDTTGASFAEISFAAGSHENDWDAGFSLLGGPVGGAPILPPTATFPNGTNPAPPASGLQWGVHTYIALGGAPTSVPDTITRMSTLTPTAGILPIMHMTDPENSGISTFIGEFPFPGNTNVDDNNYGIAARGKVVVPAAGLYTILGMVDDGFALRINGTGARWTGRYSGGFNSNVFIDANDRSTLFYIANVTFRAGIIFDAPGTYDLDFLLYEASGGSGASLAIAPGLQLVLTDTSEWTGIGDTSLGGPTIPATIPGSINGSAGLLGLHRVGSLGGTQMTNLRAAVTALSTPGVGTHSTGSVAKLNLIDPDLPGRAGYFGNDIPIPGQQVGVNDDDFALHVRGRMRIDVTGTYTFVVNATDGWALRIAGQTWNSFNGSAARDLADPSTVGWNRLNTARDGETIGRARINLAAGEYDIDFVFFERTSAASVEVFSVLGDFHTLSEYVAVGAANLGDAALRTAGYRLVGHQANPNGYWYPGIKSDGPTPGWTVKQSRPITGTTAPGGWATNWPTLDGWVDLVANNPTTILNEPFINVNDPGFGGPGPIPNDKPIQQNNAGGATSVDDNFMVTRHTATLVVPVDGIYNFGWHADDGGYFEFLNTGDARATPTFSRVLGDVTSNITYVNISTSSQGVVGARLENNPAEGGGNNRIVGEVFLAAGEWPIRALWYEGTGGAYYELFCSPSGGDATPFVLLRTSGASMSAQQDISTFPPATSFELSDLNVDRGAGTFSVTFASFPGALYVLEASHKNSAIPAEWSAVGAQITGTAAATTTTVTRPLSELTPFEIGGRVFVRVRVP